MGSAQHVIGDELRDAPPLGDVVVVRDLFEQLSPQRDEVGIGVGVEEPVDAERSGQIVTHGGAPELLSPLRGNAQASGDDVVDLLCVGEDQVVTHEPGEA